MYNKVFSKRSKNWRSELVKKPKTYDFWPTVATRILKKRIDDEETILRKVELPDDHPKKIASSIALNPVPKTSDLVEQALSRFVPHSSIVSTLEDTMEAQPQIASGMET